MSEYTDWEIRNDILNVFYSWNGIMVFPFGTCIKILMLIDILRVEVMRILYECLYPLGSSKRSKVSSVIMGLICSQEGILNFIPVSIST